MVLILALCHLMTSLGIATKGLLGSTLEIAVSGLLSITDVVDIKSGGVVPRKDVDYELLLIASAFTTILNKRF